MPSNGACASLTHPSTSLLSPTPNYPAIADIHIPSSLLFRSQHDGHTREVSIGKPVDREHLLAADPRFPTPEGAVRQRHQKKEWEALLRRAEIAGWRVERGSRYFRVLCPCGLHAASIPLTPSGRRTLVNKTEQLERSPCWKEPT